MPRHLPSLSNTNIAGPNAQKGYKINTNSFVPNPSLSTPLAFSMLEFLGKLMGLSLRTKVRREARDAHFMTTHAHAHSLPVLCIYQTPQACLPFSFPSIVWKGLLGEKPSFDDLMATDAIFAQVWL